MVTTKLRPERRQVDFLIEYQSMAGEGWLPIYSSLDHEYMLGTFRQLTKSNPCEMRLVQRVTTYRFRKKPKYEITVLREFKCPIP
jgi:hypothetical protein